MTFYKNKAIWLTLSSFCAVALLYLVLLPVVPNVSPSAFVDIRHDRSRHDYSLIFSSRTDGLQGHAYVVLVAHPQHGEYHADELGFYSIGNPFEVGALFGGPGEVESEFAQPQAFEARHAFVLWVDRDELDAARRVIDNWRDGRKRYVLFQDDCIAMLHDVAVAAGLKAPLRLPIISPDRYVQALIEVNVDAWVRTTAAVEAKG